MKKSEAIKLLKAHIKCGFLAHTSNLDEVALQHTVDLEAESILRFIEGLGMLPPKCTIRMGQNEFTDHFWEPERKL